MLLPAVYRHKPVVVTAVTIPIVDHPGTAEGAAIRLIYSANYKITLEQKTPPYRYMKSPNTVYGLAVYTPVGFDESKRSDPGKTSYDNRNVYFHRNQNGEAGAYIECSNVTPAAGKCELQFNMLPVVRADISASFRKRVIRLGFQDQPQSEFSAVVATIH